MTARLEGQSRAGCWKNSLVFKPDVIRYETYTLELDRWQLNCLDFQSVMTELLGLRLTKLRWIYLLVAERGPGRGFRHQKHYLGFKWAHLKPHITSSTASSASFLPAESGLKWIPPFKPPEAMSASKFFTAISILSNHNEIFWYMFFFPLCSKPHLYCLLVKTQCGHMACHGCILSCLQSRKKIKFHPFFRTSQSHIMARLVDYEVLKHNNILYIFSAMDSVTFIPRGHLKAISPHNKNTITIPHDASLSSAPAVQSTKHVSSFHLPFHIAGCLCPLMIFFSLAMMIS